jgi:[ribosomal protein S5]-alanine N-acetyltransferase
VAQAWRHTVGLPLSSNVRPHKPSSPVLAAIKTANLLLRPLTGTDLPALFHFMGDPSAMQHTYVAPTLEHCAARLGAYEDMRSTCGFAPWVARTSENSEPIGWGGLSVDPEEPEWGLEVSYAFSPSIWGMGYATELVQVSLAYAFGPLSAQEVHAFAKQENAASIRVLDKCGFSNLRYEPRLKRNHYLARVPSAV